MNGAQWHLALIHFPVAGVFFALLLLTYAFFRKNGDVLKVAKRRLNAPPIAHDVCTVKASWMKPPSPPLWKKGNARL